MATGHWLDAPPARTWSAAGAKKCCAARALSRCRHTKESTPHVPPRLGDQVEAKPPLWYPPWAASARQGAIALRSEPRSSVARSNVAECCCFALGRAAAPQLVAKQGSTFPRATGRHSWRQREAKRLGTLTLGALQLAALHLVPPQLVAQRPTVLQLTALLLLALQPVALPPMVLQPALVSPKALWRPKGLQLKAGMLRGHQR
mmetsp:Transcript_78526/g.218018  ORF Transcript_78526/g.218018 Transcript_78526/m.218018 type:complete len:203 (+) Transcript_78526:1045-1653(+)